MRHFSITLTFCLVLTLTVAATAKPPSASAKARTEKSASPRPASTKANAAANKAPLDPCSLLVGPEIESIQGAAPKDTKASARSASGLTVSQCYFLLPTAADSIVLTVTERAKGLGAHDPKESWEEIFHGEREAAKEREEEKETTKPENVSGLGDEGFWSPTRVGGVLYVLKGDRYLSITVGGVGDSASKLKKSKSLAEMVLKRL